MKDITRWLLSGETSGESYSAARVRRILNNDIDTLSRLHAQLSWETSWSASTLSQRAEILEAVVELQNRLVLSSRDGPFLSDLPEDLAAMIRPAVVAMTTSKYMGGISGEL